MNIQTCTEKNNNVINIYKTDYRYPMKGTNKICAFYLVPYQLVNNPQKSSWYKTVSETIPEKVFCCCPGCVANDFIPLLIFSFKKVEHELMKNISFSTTFLWYVPCKHILKSWMSICFYWYYFHYSMKN